MTRTLYRDGALADGRSPELQIGVSILVEEGRVSWIQPSDAEPDPGPESDLEVVDASGTTIVPGMVDSHSHLTLPGGAHWIDRGLGALSEQGRRDWQGPRTPSPPNSSGSGSRACGGPGTSALPRGPIRWTAPSAP